MGASRVAGGSDELNHSLDGGWTPREIGFLVGRNPGCSRKTFPSKLTGSMPDPVRILYCHCAYAQVVPKEVKEAVLRHLSDSGVAFEAVADLCEMSARRDPALQRLAGSGDLKIAACFPRAVKWLFSATQAPLSPDRTEVLNMRTQPAADVITALLSPSLQPNLPTGKVTAQDAPAVPTPSVGEVNPTSTPSTTTTS